MLQCIEESGFGRRGKDAMEQGHIVWISECRDYAEDRLAEIVRHHFADLGYDHRFFEGKKVVVKPNLVMKKAPDAAATTHPAVLGAVLCVLREMDVSPVIAESPGGLYNKQRLEGVYRACGIQDIAARYGAALNLDTSAVQMPFPEGKKVKMFHVIAPVAEADVLIDLCKLKSHSLTKMSAAVKNLFGVIPGIEKFEMHATFPDYGDFVAMLCDLCEMLCREKTVIAITDAVVGMEGNGPTAGTPRKIGALLTSPSPFASDLACEKILGFEGTVPLVREAVSRGLCPADAHALDIRGAAIDTVAVPNFKAPDSAEKRAPSALTVLSKGKLGRFFMPRPVVVRESCRGCGECVASCPKHTIELLAERKNGTRIAHIKHASCIRCYCCQELCPFHAVRVKKNVILKIISSI